MTAFLEKKGGLAVLIAAAGALLAFVSLGPSPGKAGSLLLAFLFFVAVVEGCIAAAAADLIDALQRRSSGTINLESSTQARRHGRRRYSGETSNRTETNGLKPGRTHRRSTDRRATTKKGLHSVANAEGARVGNRKAPTAKMVAYAQTIARTKKAPLPEGYQQDFDVCRRFLDEHAK